MGEFLQDYGFFIVIAALMLFCHLGHGGHGHRRSDDRGGRSGGGGHER